MMELRFRLLLAVSCHMVIFTRIDAIYETYIVEQDCPSGKLNISLTDGGPMSAILLRATEHTSYSITMDCQITITAPSSHGIMVSVLEIGFRVRPTGNCIDYIHIQDVNAICENIFRLDEERHYSLPNTAQIKYHVSQEGLDNSTFSGLPGMKLSVTAFKKGKECQSDKDWFRCDNGNCIWSGLKCDSHNNCGDLSDEQDCSGGGNQSTVLIILGVLILLLMLIMCIATLLCSKNERIRRFSNQLRSRTLSYMPKFSKKENHPEVMKG